MPQGIFHNFQVTLNINANLPLEDKVRKKRYTISPKFIFNSF